MIVYAALDVMAAVAVWRRAVDQGHMIGARHRPQTNRTKRRRLRLSGPPPATKRARSQRSPSNPRDSTLTPANELRRLRSLYPRGTELRKRWGGEWFPGVIKQWYDNDDGEDVFMCRVEYDDGDSEDLEEHELVIILKNV